MSSEVQIKGTRHGLVILVPQFADFDELKSNLCQKIETANGFFQGAQFTIQREEAALPVAQQQELEQLLTGYGLVPTTNIPPVIRQPRKKTNPASNRTHMLWQTIRSGQQVRHDLGHVVIMGDVHSGALVEASGHVIVMGNCAGTVRAGIHGNRKAKVVGLAFKGAVVCIAEAYVTTGESESGSVPDPGPSSAALQDDKIVFNPLAKS